MDLHDFRHGQKREKVGIPGHGQLSNEYGVFSYSISPRSEMYYEIQGIRHAFLHPRGLDSPTMHFCKLQTV